MIGYARRLISAFSALLAGVAALHGNLLDATILTGFSATFVGIPGTFAAFGLRFASEADEARFGTLHRIFK